MQQTFTCLVSFVVLLLSLSAASVAQSVTISPGGAACGGSVVKYKFVYNASGASQSSCKTRVTVTEGILTDVNQSSYTYDIKNEVDVRWNDKNAKGIVMVEILGCQNLAILASSAIAVPIRSFIGVQPPEITSSATSISINNTAEQTYSIPVMSYPNDGSTAAVSYEWQYPAGWTVSSGANSNIIKLIPSANCSGGGIRVRAKSCNNTYSNWSNTVNITRTSNTETPSFTAGVELMCNGQTSTFSANLPNATSYSWEVTGGLTINGAATATTTTGSIQVSAPASGSAQGQAIVRVRATTGCGVSNWATKSTYALPPPSYPQSTSANFNSLSPFGINSACFNLDYGYRITNVYSSNENVFRAEYAQGVNCITLYAANAGYAVLTLEINEYLCSSTTNNYTFGIYVEAGGDDGGGGGDNPAARIAVHPNPTSDYLKIENLGDGYTEDMINIKLYDSSGKLVKNILTQHPSSEMDVSDLPKGLYIMKLYSNYKFDKYKGVQKRIQIER